MKIAVPVAQGKLCLHFGHCEQFAIIEVDKKSKSIKNKTIFTPPPPQPGVLPPWMAEQGVKLVIAGGMGARAIGLFNQLGVEVIVGAPSDDPEKIVMDYLNGTLQTQAFLFLH